MHAPKKRGMEISLKKFENFRPDYFEQVNEHNLWYLKEAIKGKKYPKGLIDLISRCINISPAKRPELDKVSDELDSRYLDSYFTGKQILSRYSFAYLGSL